MTEVYLPRIWARRRVRSKRIAAQLSIIETQLIRTVLRPEFTMRGGGGLGRQTSVIDLKPTYYKKMLKSQKEGEWIEKDCWEGFAPRTTPSYLKMEASTIGNNISIQLKHN